MNENNCKLLWYLLIAYIRNAKLWSIEYYYIFEPCTTCLRGKKYRDCVTYSAYKYIIRC